MRSFTLYDGKLGYMNWYFMTNFPFSADVFLENCIIALCQADSWSTGGGLDYIRVFHHGETGVLCSLPYKYTGGLIWDFTGCSGSFCKLRCGYIISL